MSRTDAHKPWKYRYEDEKPQGGSSARYGKYTRILHAYGWPRCGKPIRKREEHANRQRTKRMLEDPDNMVNLPPVDIDWQVC